MIPASGRPPWRPDHPRTLPRTGNPTPPRGARPEGANYASPGKSDRWVRWIAPERMIHEGLSRSASLLGRHVYPILSRARISIALPENAWTATATGIRTARRASPKRRARPRAPTVPRRPYGALGQRGPLGPAPLRFGPPAAHRGERAGLRGRPLIGASCKQGSWKGPRPHAHDHNAHTLDFASGEPPACGPCRPRTSFIHSGLGRGHP